jgi:hypothetical protein
MTFETKEERGQRKGCKRTGEREGGGTKRDKRDDAREVDFE